METPAYHIPALLPQALQALDIRPDGVYVDCTFGGGGHSRAILQALGSDGRLLAFDQDSDAAARAMADSTFVNDTRFTFVLGNFRFLTNYLRFYSVSQGTVNGILADLGVSFHHFDDPDRGFSFRWEGPLDMRMNKASARTAASLIASVTVDELTDILRLYGELPKASSLARAIVTARQQQSIETIPQLLQIVEPLTDPRQRKKELAQIFQALRIVVNGEIDALQELLSQTVTSLAPSGRLAIITYHSLEDRLVKNFMRSGNINGRIEKDFYGRNLSPFRLITSKPIAPSEQEILENPRSRSAKLRVAQKL